MQRIIELANDHRLGGTDGTPIKMITFLQPAIPYTPLPVETSTVTEMCYKLDIEMSSASRLISLNSSIIDSRLKTFVSQTEGIMMNEVNDVITPHYQDLRTRTTFQTLTGLQNKPQGSNTGHMQKCNLNTKPTWMSQSRSSGKALSYKFLADYSSAVYADYCFAKNQVKVKQIKERRALVTPRPETLVFRELRAMDPNMVMPIHLWTNECNKLEDEPVFKCSNIMTHKTSLVFNSTKSWKTHATECYGEGKITILNKLRMKQT